MDFLEGIACVVAPLVNMVFQVGLAVRMCVCVCVFGGVLLEWGGGWCGRAARWTVSNVAGLMAERLVPNSHYVLRNVCTPIDLERRRIQR